MNDKARIAGIIGVAVALIVVIIFRADMPALWGPLLTMLAALLGLAPMAKSIRRRRAMARGQNPDEDPGLTWDEVHIFICGLGDGFALNKADAIPTGTQADETYSGILAREAWYYKTGMAVGRALWVPMVMAAVIAIVREVGLIL